LFAGVLDAIRYAHARGVIHRDIKPANIMIGQFGEVTVLDWGIAKPIRREQAGQAGAVEPLAKTHRETGDRRLQETQLGALAGTPLYMSPEQAAGRNSELDERSDVYSLCVVLYEWLALAHPLADKRTVTEVLAATINGFDVPKLMGVAMSANVPAEWIRLVARGLDVKHRYASVDELEREIRNLLEGRVRVQCHITFTKRTLNAASHWIDRHPKLFSLTFLGGIAALLAYGIYRLVA
jgi:serine/threonine-protein kinase